MKDNKTIVLGGGCFWCLEAFFQLFKGVTEVTPGYAGGTTKYPTYEQVCNGIGNHVEVIQISYDPKVLTLETILEVFWAIHNPTTPNQQGYDHGPQYRSALYYSDKKELATANKVLQMAQQNWDNPIVTEIKPLIKFYEAEKYHKNFFLNNPTKAYCQIIINPKIKMIKKSFDSLML